MTALSTYQTAILDYGETGDAGDHGVVHAYAGSGKTFLLREYAARIDDDETMLCGAFNTSIAAELADKIHRANTEICTLHSLGFRTLRKMWRGKSPKLPEDGARDWLAYVVSTVVPESHGDDVRGDVKTLCEKAMAFVIDMPEAGVEGRLIDLMVRFECLPAPDRQDLVPHYATWALKILAKLREPADTICFSQMLYVPAWHKWKTGYYRHVLADEVQDFNRAQLIVARAALHSEGRFMAWGDRFQAIYGWNGADETGMDKLRDAFRARVFKLPISYRAPESVAELVRGYIPDFEARPGAPDGEVIYCDEARMRREWRPGDMFLSRKNAPLMRMCLAALADNVPAYVRGGKDVTRGLFDLIKKSKQHDVVEFLKWLKRHEERQAVVLEATKRPAKVAELHDTVAVLEELAETCDTTRGLRDHIERLFVDVEPEGKLQASSVHKAKGLETADGQTVWLDAGSFRDDPDEERRIAYVAWTRTRDRLAFVTLAGNKKRKKYVAYEQKGGGAGPRDCGQVPGGVR